MVSDFNKKENRNFFNKKFFYKAGGIFFLIAVAFLIYKDVQIYQKKRQLALQINNYKEQIKNLEESNKTLNEEIANADDVDYLEKIAYEQLGEQRPGEKQFIFITPEEKEQAESEPDKSAWQNFTASISGFWAWIKSRF